MLSGLFFSIIGAFCPSTSSPFFFAFSMVCFALPARGESGIKRSSASLESRRRASPSGTACGFGEEAPVVLVRRVAVSSVASRTGCVTAVHVGNF